MPDDKHNDEIVEQLPSGETIPIDEVPDMGPDTDYIINTQSADDLTMYAFDFAEQALDSGASYSDWTPTLSLEDLVENPVPILDAIHAVRDAETARDWSQTDGRPSEIREVATSFGQYLLSRVVIHAWTTDQIDVLPVEVLNELAGGVDAIRNSSMYATVFLAHTHPEFPKNMALENPVLYTPGDAVFPYEIRPLAVLWCIDDSLFYEAVESVLDAVDEIVPPWEAHAAISRDQWIESVVHHVVAGFVREDNPLPIVFTGDTEGTLTLEVASTLPNRTKDDYRELIDWAIEWHSMEFTPEEFLEECAPFEGTEGLLS